MEESIKIWKSKWNSKSLIGDQTTAEWTEGFAERQKAEDEGEVTIRVGTTAI